MTLCPLTPEEYRFAWDLNQSEVPHLGSETLEELERLCRISVSAWLARVDGAPAGFLLGMTKEADYDSPNFLWFRERYRDFLYVDRLAVARAHRRAGIGAALYGKAAEDARRLGAPHVLCEVNLSPPNPVSLAFHERIGFRRVGEQVAEGKTVAMMELAVPGQ